VDILYPPWSAVEARKKNTPTNGSVEFPKVTLETRTLLSQSQTYTKPSTFVKYVIELVCTANLITYLKFAEG